jgi:NAD(P)-dependent dehydrogenase (short-subunit alcohol dehydrogenase family)
VPAPERPIAKELSSAGLLAHVLISKYCDHLPLYRQSQIFARQGVMLNRSTLANWVGGASWWLEALRERLATHIFASNKLFADDTPMPVLDPGRGRTRTGRLWVPCRQCDRRDGDLCAYYGLAIIRRSAKEVTAIEPLAGRNVVVTGGTGALGEIVVARLTRAGAICHVPSRRATSASLAEKDDRLRIVPGIDLTDETTVDRFYDAVPELWASVHMAGGFAMAPVAETARADFLHMIEMNALTAFLCSRAAVRAIRKTGRGGRIVNVSARPGLDPRKGARMAAYATSKAAVAAITLALAEELKDDRILVNAIAPSTIDTAANRRAMPNADTSKWVMPEAAAEAVLQLVSPANMEISGAVLPLYARA